MAVARNLSGGDKKMRKMIIAGIIAFVLLTSVGLASATHVFSMDLDISNGYAFQGIKLDGYKYNVVAIGNFDVVADCVAPWELPESIGEIAIGDMYGGDYDYLDYDFDVHGSGSIQTTFAEMEFGIYQFQQDVVGTTVAIAQQTDIRGNTQEVLVATDGYMNWSEQMMVDINTDNGDIQSVGISQSAVMDDWGFGQSLLFNKVDFGDVNFDLYQYAAAPDITWGFNFMYPIIPGP